MINNRREKGTTTVKRHFIYSIDKEVMSVDKDIRSNDQGHAYAGSMHSGVERLFWPINCCGEL